MLTFGKRTTVHKYASAVDVAALKIEVVTLVRQLRQLESQYGLLATKEDLRSLPLQETIQIELNGLFNALLDDLTQRGLHEDNLATKEDVKPLTKAVQGIDERLQASYDP